MNVEITRPQTERRRLIVLSSREIIDETIAIDFSFSDLVKGISDKPSKIRSTTCITVHKRYTKRISYWLMFRRVRWLRPLGNDNFFKLWRVPKCAYLCGVPTFPIFPNSAPHLVLNDVKNLAPDFNRATRRKLTAIVGIGSLDT